MSSETKSGNGCRSFETHVRLIVDIPPIDPDREETDDIALCERAISQVSSQVERLGRWDISLTPANYTTQEYKTKTKIRLYHVSVAGTVENDLRSTLDQLLTQLNRTANDAELVSAAKVQLNELLYLWDDLAFEAREVDTAVKYAGSEPEQMRYEEQFRFAGHLSRDKIDQIGLEEPFDTDDTTTFIEEMKGGSRRSDVVDQIDDDVERASFLFIRALQDYGNTAPSEVFVSELLSLHSKYSFLFRPDASEWDTLLDMKAQQREKVLRVVLNRLSGLLRRSFTGVIRDWVSMIRYLRNRCDGDPRKFFEQAAEDLDVDSSDPHALEELQSKLEGVKKEEPRERIGLDFSFSKKIGRLLFTLMTDNERGYDLLKGVSREQVENFNLPVDAQIIRLTLNLGILQIETTACEEVTFEANTEGEKTEVTKEGVELQRGDLDEVCRRAWKEVAEQVSKAPAELDHILWSIGSTLGNRRGALCMACPLASACDAWENREIFEAGGSEWNQGGYTFARAHTDRDSMIILEDWEPFKVEPYTDEQPRLTFGEISDVLKVENE